jgi:S1-C subfamily serine protease
MTARIPELVRGVAPSVVTLLGVSNQGSGVVWSANGLIVTANHVVPFDEPLQVVFADGARIPGVVVARDPATDLAVVRVERGDVRPAHFELQPPEIGELVVALGSPPGLENSVTAGIISGAQRTISLSLPEPLALAGLLQTDASISPGNSGGALVNMAGDVVGINNAASLPEKTGIISFAIPTSTVVTVVARLLNG